MTQNTCSESTELSQPSTGISVEKFFSGQNVFITGGLGFMGKILVEKILWSCEDVGNIYLLIRSKKGFTALKRVEELLKLPVFDRLKKRNPASLKKIIPIEGDVLEPNLNISDNDRKFLENSISIVFHAASSVRFDDSLKKAIFVNIRGSKYVMDIAKNMKKLKVLLYVSTTFCNVLKNKVEEKVYVSNYDWRNLINMAENIDESILNALTPKILNEHPNTYTFSKYFAENLIYEYSKELPCVIFRPSIVTFSLEEPTPGWIDNMNGPMGLSMGFFSGIFHVLYADRDVPNDYTPCDYAINGLMVAGWYKGISDSKECLVINGANGGKTIMSLSDVSDRTEEILTELPPHRMLWYPFLFITKNPYVYYFLYILTHLIPGIFFELILRFQKNDIKLMALYRKIYLANKNVSVFILNEWKFDTKNYDSLRNFLSEEDKKTYNYDLSTLNKEEALRIGLKGMKKYLFKEETTKEVLDADEKFLSRMYWLHQITKCLIFGSILYISWSLVKYINFDTSL